MLGLKVGLVEAFARISEVHAATRLADMEASCAWHLGVIEVTQASTAGMWERHDGGDELLIVVSGRMRMTLRRSDVCQSDERFEVAAGEALVIRRGVAHSAELLTD